jgi:hypothetical protein
MKTVYAVTHTEKAVSDWTPDGASTQSNILASHGMDIIKADSLKQVLNKIKSAYGYEGDYWFITADEDSSSVSFNRLEEADGTPVEAKNEDAHFARGETLYLCDYTFWIEKRTVSPLIKDDFEELDLFKMDASFA